MYQIVLCTCPNQECAKAIASHLIKNKLAACVNIVTNITSFYEWEGKLVEENEIQLLIKTKANMFNQLNEQISQIHPYDVPEIIALDITQGNTTYLQWINEAI